MVKNRTNIKNENEGNKKNSELPIEGSKPLSNLRQETFCREIIKTSLKTGANKKTAYINAYKDVKDSTAIVNSSKLLKETNVANRISYLLDQYKHTKLPSILESFKDDLSASDPIIHKGEEVGRKRSHSTILDTKKTILKLHGLLSNDTNLQIDARQVHLGLSQGDTGELQGIIDNITKLNKSLGISDDVS